MQTWRERDAQEKRNAKQGERERERERKEMKYPNLPERKEWNIKEEK